MASDWQISTDRIAALCERDTPMVAEPNRTLLLSQGSPTPTAVVLLHGYTNAPVQMREVARAYFDAGSNVLVPRVPFHGYTDPYTRELTNVTPKVLEEFSNQVVDAASGLGDDLLVVGLSLGGLLAGYMAKMRDEVSLATLVSPFIQPNAVPEWVNAPFDAVMGALPDIYSWWNPKLQEKEVAGTYATPKFSMKAVAAQIAFRRRLDSTPAGRTTKLERVVLVVNHADIAVRNDVARSFVENELAPLAKAVDIVEIEKSLGFTHDVFEPNGDNRERMDAVRDRLWPILGLTPPPHGSLLAATPGGGYFPQLAPWSNSD